MKLRKIKPDKIMIPEVRVTAQFDKEIWEQFRSSIKEVGQIAPIICCLVDSQFVLVDGLHRLVEAKKAGAEYVDVAVIDGDMVDVLTKNIFLDHLRGKTPVSEMVNVIEVLWKEYGLDSEKIAQKTGMTRDYVEKLQLISELTPACRKALDEERIKVGHAVALTRVKDPVRQETVLGQLLLYNWTVKDLEAYIKDVLELVVKREEEILTEAPPVPFLLECKFCHGKFDISQIANPNICTECAGVMLTSITQARREFEQEGAPKTE